MLYESVLFNMRLSSLLFLGLSLAAKSDGSNLTLVSTCTCPGYEIVYQCSVAGFGTTVWQGTVFDLCSDGPITLRHTQFTGESGTSFTRTCGLNGATISGRSIAAEGNVFISQLSISVTEDTHGRTVQCAHNSGFNITIVGTNQISPTTASLPPPSNVTLSINSEQLAFTWTPVSQNCPAIHYNIISSSCGQCPSTTTSSLVICSNISNSLTTQPNTCTFIVQTVVCNSILGTTTEPLTIQVKVIGVNNVMFQPEYSGESGSLNKIMLQFTHLEVDNAALFYTVTYFDAHSSNVCGSDTIQATLCNDGRCRHHFEISSSSCPPLTNILITMIATNIFGDGPPSDPLLISGFNNFVDLDFDLVFSNTVSCIFVNQKDTSIKSCTIVYGVRRESVSKCTKFSFSANGDLTVSNKITIPLYLLSGVTSYCYLLTAANGSMNVTVKGIFTIECDPAQLSNHSVSVPDSGICGSYYYALSMDNGIICFNGNTPGSTAVYFCMKCCYSTLPAAFIRTCGEDGQWDGTIPKCDCDTFQYLWIPISLLTVFMATTAISVMVIIALVRAKLKLKSELERNRESRCIYEEVHQAPQTDTNTIVTENVAYSYGDNSVIF